MSRKYLNDRWCIRCGRKTPTPYLAKVLKLFSKKGMVLDIGCGNGRNSVFMTDQGYNVKSIDMANDFGNKIILGKDTLPDGPFQIILANYIFMFLDELERSQLFREIQRISEFGTIFVIEMYPAKDAYSYDFDEIIDYFLENGWKKLRKSRDKCVLKML